MTHPEDVMIDVGVQIAIIAAALGIMYVPYFTVFADLNLSSVWVYTFGALGTITAVVVLNTISAKISGRPAFTFGVTKYE